LQESSSSLSLKLTIYYELLFQNSQYLRTKRITELKRKIDQGDLITI